MEHRPGLDPAVAEIRRAVRECLAGIDGPVLVGLSGGADSLALAAAVAFEAPKAGVRASATVIDHGLQSGSAQVAARGLPVWEDPHNLDRRYLRVRVRQDVMPVLEAELGPGVAEALARTSDQLREDAAAFADMIDETIEDIVEHAEAGIAVSVPALAANPPAIRNRIIRHVVASEFGASLTRAQTLEVARLVTDWHGQGPIALPGCQASRSGTRLTFTAP